LEIIINGKTLLAGRKTQQQHQQNEKTTSLLTEKAHHLFSKF
jgi:hypothetical protein